MTPTRRLLLGAGIAALLATQAEASEVLTPTENNFTAQAEPAAVQAGNTASLRNKVAAKNAKNAAGRTIFLKFSLADNLPSPGDTATLSLTTSAKVPTDFNIQVYALNAGEAGHDWAASTLKWESSPALGTKASTHYIDTSAVTLLGSFDVLDGADSESTYSVPLTIADWSACLQTDGTITLITVVQSQSDSGGQVLFYSSGNGAAGTTMPQLTIVRRASSR